MPSHAPSCPTHCTDLLRGSIRPGMESCSAFSFCNINGQKRLEKTRKKTNATYITYLTHGSNMKQHGSNWSNDSWRGMFGHWHPCVKSKPIEVPYTLNLYSPLIISNSGQKMKRLLRTPHDSGVWQVSLSPNRLTKQCCCCKSHSNMFNICSISISLDHHRFFPFSPGSATTIAASHGPNKMHLTHLTLTTLSIPLDARHMAEWPVPRSDDSAVSILPIQYPVNMSFGICLLQRSCHFPCLSLSGLRSRF